MFPRPVRAQLAPIALCSSLAALACGHAEPAPDSPGAGDYYRARLSDSPSGKRAGQVRDSLESAEFFAAKRQATILAWRTFLSEFPDGAHQREARMLLESLRWNDASAANSEPALQGFLADEPHGAHADEAWARIAELELVAAMSSRNENELQAWLAAHPSAPGHEQASVALAEAAFRAAASAPLHLRRERLRAYLANHPDGAQRGEAQTLEARAAVDEAALLGDESELRAWVRSGNLDSSRALAELAFADASSRLDARDLAELAGTPTSPVATRAAALVADLKHRGAAARELVAAAQALHLPALHEAPSDWPTAPRDRAQTLRLAALSLDGRLLEPLLAEISSPASWVAQSALEASLFLVRSLPGDEARLRGARASASLKPIAQDGSHLAALAVALVAEGDAVGALSAARAAAARDPRSLVAQLISATLEADLGEPSLAIVAARTLSSAVRSALDAHASATHGAAADAPPAEGEQAPRLWALCAADLGARTAAGLLGFAVSANAEQEQARSAAAHEADGLVANADQRVSEAERAAHKEGGCAAEREFFAAAQVKQSASRAKAVALLLGAGELSAAALARARERDPADAVRTALHAEPFRSAGLLPLRSGIGTR